MEVFCVITCTLLFLVTAFSVATVLFGWQPVGTRDYIEYWASGQQLVQHGNPYDAAVLLGLERAQGLPVNIPVVVMGNAPPALLLTYPLGFLSVRAGEILWMLLLLASFIGAVWLIAETVAPKSQVVKAIGYSFAPAILCVPAGQMALFVLLGLAIFLRCYKTRPVIAGAALWLCLLKPQLFVPFGLVMCVWIVTTRQLKVLLGAGIALGASVVLISVIDPHCWVEYRAMMQLMRYDKVIIPCWSVILRDSLPRIPFLQYLPASVGSVWAITYFWKNKRDWDWIEHGAVLMLVSLLVAPYTWFIDQCVALPALLRGVAVTRRRLMIAALAMATAVIEFGLLTKHDLLHSNFYLWTTPFYLVWYLLTVRGGADSTKLGETSAETSRAQAHVGA